MSSNVYLQRLVAAVVKESGISRATCEQVIPVVFDVIRRELTEGQWRCVPIESFGTFATIDIPEREYRSTYKGNKVVHLPSTKRLKFAPARNMMREAEEGVFDSTRVSFKHHPKDPVLRKKSNLQYQPNKEGIFKGSTRPVTSGHHNSRSDNQE